MTRDKDGQALMPGWLDAVAAGRIRTEGNFPGGGGLFAPQSAAREAPARQLSLGGELCPCGNPECDDRHCAAALNDEEE